MSKPGEWWDRSWSLGSYPKLFEQLVTSFAPARAVEFSVYKLMTFLAKGNSVTHVKPKITVFAPRNAVVSIEVAATGVATHLTGVMVALEHSLSPIVRQCRHPQPMVLWSKTPFPARIPWTTSRCFANSLADFLFFFWGSFKPKAQLVSTHSIFESCHAFWRKFWFFSLYYPVARRANSISAIIARAVFRKFFLFSPMLAFITVFQTCFPFRHIVFKTDILFPCLASECLNAITHAAFVSLPERNVYV